MTTFCLAHNEPAYQDGGCYYCRLTTKPIEEKQAGLLKDCAICGKSFQAKRHDQKTCLEPDCRLEWHRKISRKAMAALKKETND